MKSGILLSLVLPVLFAAAAAVMMPMALAGDSDAAYTVRKDDGRTSGDGHILVDLWEEYCEAVSADRPQKEVEILDKIIRKSMSLGLPWDFYDALYKWYQSEVSRNWKQRDKALERVAADAAVFGNAVVDFNLSLSGLLDKEIDKEWVQDNVLDNAAALERSCNRAFYVNDRNLAGSDRCAPFIVSLIANDYEYLLWSVSRGYSVNGDEVRKLAEEALRSYAGDSYPSGAYLAYLDVLDKAGGPDMRRYIRECPADSLGDFLLGRKSLLEEFAGKYDGRAIALYAMERMLLDRKQLLDMGQDGTAGLDRPESSDYEDLREDCRDFIRLQKSYRGDEKTVAESLSSVGTLAEELDSRSAGLYADGYEIGVVFRNVDSAVLELRKDAEDGEIVHSAEIDNARRSYYLLDTVRYRLPEIPDGDYMLVCRYGKEMSRLRYPVFSLSIARRTVTDAGCGIYLAWQDSGRPVEKADVEILSKGEVVRQVKDFSFDGFTPVQEILEEVAGEHDGALMIRCSMVDRDGICRRSPDLFLSESDFENILSEDTGDSRQRRQGAVIYKDRGAFNPGDSVQFKTVLYSYSGSGDYAVEPDRDLDVRLTGPDGDSVSEMTLKTNGFGSAAGVFALPKGLKGGTYHISVNVSGSAGFLARSALTVDEFVLPTYTMEFMDDSLVWFPGDTVIVRGRLSSYSGHSVSAAKIGYGIASYVSGTEPVYGETAAADDGTFEIRFRAGFPAGDISYWYYPSVKVTDLTGETYEWSGRPVYINPKMTLFTSLLNEAEGYADMLPEASCDRVKLMSCDTARLRFSTLSSIPVSPVEYEVTRDGRHILSGSAMTGQEFVMDLSGQPSGIYHVRSRAVYTHYDGRMLEDVDEIDLLKVSASDTSMDCGVESFFRKIEDGRVSALVGAGDGEQWFVVELHDAGGRLLHSEMLRMDGRNGEDGSVCLISYGFDQSWTDAVTMLIFGFKGGEVRSDSFTYSRSVPEEQSIPLSFTRFVDRSLPGTRLGFCLETSPSAECLVSVYDKSADNIRGNAWTGIRFREYAPVNVRVRAETGRIGQDYYGNVVPFQLVEESAGAVMASPAMRSKSAAADNVAAMDYLSADGSAGTTEQIDVRDRFDNTIAFLPFLYPDNDGSVEFDIDVTDKLSTYYVSVFAHDPLMRNAVLRKEMVVSLPVKVSVVEPRFLYEGDLYNVLASVSNSSEHPMSGKLSLYVYDTKDYKHSEPVMSRAVQLSVGTGSAVAEEFAVEVPAGADTLGFKVVYSTVVDGVAVSDAMFVSVPVLEPVQTLTEAHSALFLPGMDRDSLKHTLETAFTGISAVGSEYREIPLLDMLMESVSGKTEPDAKDVLSLTEAYYMRMLAAVIMPEEKNASGQGSLLDGILSCQNRDGGFGWFEGFPSSPVITAVVLERFAALRSRGICVDSDADGSVPAGVGTAMPAAVAYMDSTFLSTDRPLWYGGISLQQYLYVRSMYPEVLPVFSKDGERFKEFAAKVRDFLLPKKGRGLDGDILAKARRVSVLLSLSHPGSESLALALGLKKKDLKRLVPSACADVLSLSEYAVPHPSGGFYFPNAVMPFRGLLESEVYAHSVLCDLMHRYHGIALPGNVRGADRSAAESLQGKAAEIAEGIRLWLMLQKETQQWESDPAYFNAVVSVLDGSASLKSANISVMTKRYVKPFGNIVPAGNEMSVERLWYRLGEDEKLIPVADGDTLDVGDRLVAEYRIWSRENRSFVQLVSPYYAALRPVDQLSGRTGGWFRPVRVSGPGLPGSGIIPCGYREVKSDRTIYYFDVCPEEKISFKEEFNVTQAGTFSAPVMTVECLYSPHYRANGAAEPKLVSEVAR